MQFTLHTEFPENLREQWNELLKQNSSNVPFLRYEYLADWWQTRGGGEWPQAELAIVTAEKDGKLAGVAPFFKAEYQGKPSLLLLGAIEISDYLDVICAPANLAEFLTELFKFLPTMPMAWEQLVFHNLLETSTSLPALEQATADAAWQSALEPMQNCPRIELGEDWETYLAGIDKKQRHEIRRKLRRAENSGHEVALRICSGGEGLEEDAASFLRLMEFGKEKAKFLTPAMRTQITQSMHTASEHGLLNLAFLEVDGQPAAAYYNFDYQNQLWVYNSGFDPQYLEYSPGWVLLGHLIQWTVAHQKRYVDFMRGDEEYKYRFGAINQRVMQLTITK